MVFDSDGTKVGQQIGEFVVKDTSDMIEAIRAAGVKVAMLSVPDHAAQEVTEMLVEAGVKAILNYAPISLTVPEGVRVQHIDPATHLQRMTYYL
jgi:redox-sensing transcriptional repressor